MARILKALAHAQCDPHGGEARRRWPMLAFSPSSSHCRDLDRERVALQNEEKKIIVEIKKMAKEGQMVRAAGSSSVGSRFSPPNPSLHAFPLTPSPSAPLIQS